MCKFPDGLIALPLDSAVITSSGVTPYDRSRSGSARSTIERALPPNGGGADTPGSDENIGLTLNSARSWMSAIVLVELDSTRYPTGTLPVSNRITNGETVPGGMKARERLT